MDTNDKTQLSLRALLVGVIVGSLVACTNLYIGLQVGWALGGSIITAMFSIALFQSFSKIFKTQQLTMLEANIAQTAGSAAGSMAMGAGLITAIPALGLLGFEYSFFQLILWSLSVSLLGVCIAIPLRHRFIVRYPLKFPSGAATAEILKSIGTVSAKAKHIKLLAICFVAALSFTLLTHFYPWVQSPKLLPAVIAGWGFGVYISPALIGAGFIIEKEAILSLFLGSLVAWLCIGPTINYLGWTPANVMAMDGGARGWLLWPGAALMIGDSLTGLFLTVYDSYKQNKVKDKSFLNKQQPKVFTNSWFAAISIVSVFICMTMHFVFQIYWLHSLFAIGMSFVLSIVATKAQGETDINPVGGVAKVSQIGYGLADTSSLAANLFAGGITAAGASQAADLMQDYKTGHLIGACPKRQLASQCFGVLAGALVVVPAYLLLTSAYEIGGDKLPAPAAHSWKAMAQLLTDGPESLPQYSGLAILIALVVGFLLALRKKTKPSKFNLSGVALGIAFIIPAKYSLAIVGGYLILSIWKSRKPGLSHQVVAVVAAGLIAGEGLMGFVKAALSIIGK